ncbi:alpha/beta fold hydrolase [Vibrio panuliri]|uniref:Oxidoreductase n=1 Tax=Vibrio panuliri TaxID=1381081 RepID=A0ABX3FG33_9VIBR|nr:alpha/beta hydrolase [Vibrio panuliri]KAB1458109.1 alpha/beta hydrolase [Vibrio panuliri]OLQ89507.1 oxidoreductase [Vibrio panuliri]
MSGFGQHLLIDGAEIYYQVSGNPDGQSLVMLHGGLGSSEDLEGLMKFIPDLFKVIRIDLRGHGRSTLGEHPLTYTRYQQDVEAVLDTLQVDKFHLFGFSDGGTVGYRIAACDERRVLSLSTLGSQWRLEPDDPSIELYQGLTADFWQQEFAEEIARYEEINPQPDFNHLVAQVKKLWLDTFDSGYPDELVEEITCATLIMRGDKDFLFSLTEAEELCERIEESEFFNVPFTEHEAHKEYPEVVGEVLRRFLQINH